MCWTLGLKYQCMPALKSIQLRGLPWQSKIRTSPSSAGVGGSIPNWGVNIPPVLGPKNKNIKQKQYYSKVLDELRVNPRSMMKGLKGVKIEHRPCLCKAESEGFLMYCLCLL